jgi:hypothetical protein
VAAGIELVVNAQVTQASGTAERDAACRRAHHNLRMILRKLRLFYALVLVALLDRNTANSAIA